MKLETTKIDYLTKYSLDELQSYFSDFHKSFYGFRPRFALHLDAWNDRKFLEESIDEIHKQMDKMKETFAGREELRQQGWVVEETDADLAKHAKFLQDERDREAKEADDRWNALYLKSMQEADAA